MQIKDFPNYEITEDGQVFSKNKNAYLSIWLDKDGYPSVKLYKDSKPQVKRVHRLIAEHFLPNPNNLPFVHHLDANRENCAISNLQWISIEGNNQDSHILQALRTKMGKKVGQYSLKTGELLNVFLSSGEAAEKTGISASGIREACRGVYKQMRGFAWKYLD